MEMGTRIGMESEMGTHIEYSHYSQAGVKCSLKVNEGLIYPLEDALLFIPKPATYMAYADIATIVFSRVGSSVSASRTFDMKILMKKGGDFMFSGINKEEHPNLDAFFKLKKLRVKNELAPDEVRGRASVESIVIIIIFTIIMGMCYAADLVVVVLAVAVVLVLVFVLNVIVVLVAVV